MQAKAVAIRTGAIGLCTLTLLAAACSSSGGHSATADTTSPTSVAVTSTTDGLQTPNSIPYVVGEQIGLRNGWIVRVARVTYPASIPGLPTVAADQRYVAIDLFLQNSGTASHDVRVDALFTLTDSQRQAHFVVPVPGVPNGVDGSYAPGTKHSGRLVFRVPKHVKLGLVLAGPRIGTAVSLFAIDPPNVAPDQT